MAATKVAGKTRRAGHTRTARSRPQLQSRIHQILVSFGQCRNLGRSRPKAIGKSCVATMSGERAILLISDRPDRSRELARRLGGHYACQMIGLHEHPSTGAPVAAVASSSLVAASRTGRAYRRPPAGQKSPGACSSRCRWRNLPAPCR
jgi:hypothetical protein